MKKNKSAKPDLGTAPVGRLLFSLAIPCITAQIINVLYNIVDRMYIGHIPNVGYAALTGLGVTMPLITTVSAFAALVCMGAAPRAAIFLGRNDKETSERILSGSFTLLVIIALILTVIVELFGQNLLVAFGASETTLPYAWSYIRIYAIGTIFVQVALGLNAFINAQGYSVWGMATVCIGALLNIVLDPIFIFMFNMGVQGAALATIISQGVSAIFVLWFLNSKNSYLHIQKQFMRLDFRILGPCLALGLSPFIMQITESLLTISFNTSLMRYGGDLAVGSMTILSSIMQFAVLPLQGLCQGGQPILSYNFGAGNKDRVLHTFKLLLTCCLTYSISMCLLCEIAPGMMARMFTSTPELIEYTSWALRIYIAGICIFGMQIACQQTFVSLGNAKTSLFLAIFRKIILLIPLIYILPMFIPNKVFAVFLAEPVSDVVASITTAFMFYRYAKHKLPALIAANKATADAAKADEEAEVAHQAA